MKVWGPLIQIKQKIECELSTWQSISYFDTDIWPVMSEIDKMCHVKVRNWTLLLRRSGWSLVVGIHTEAAVASHSWALEQRKREEEASERPHLCLKGANRQGQRAGPAADALH